MKEYIWVFEIFVIIGLAVTNGVLSMAEIAIVSSRKTKLQQLADDGVKGAKIALDLLKEPTEFLASIHVGITIISILSGAVGGATLSDQLSAYLKAHYNISEFMDTIAFILVVLGISYNTLI